MYARFSKILKRIKKHNSESENKVGLFMKVSDTKTLFFLSNSLNKTQSKIDFPLILEIGLDIFLFSQIEKPIGPDWVFKNFNNHIFPNWVFSISSNFPSDRKYDSNAILAITNSCKRKNSNLLHHVDFQINANQISLEYNLTYIFRDIFESMEGVYMSWSIRLTGEVDNQTFEKFNQVLKYDKSIGNSIFFDLKSSESRT